MPLNLFKYTDSIRSTITSFLNGMKGFVGVSRWGKDVQERLVTFVPNGKLVRSNLALTTAELLGVTIEECHIQAASSLEFFHSSLLIHDDIIDKDDLRRGQRSLPKQYRDLTSEYEPHLGTSLAICAGDIGFFFAYELIGTAKLEPKQQVDIMTMLSKEMALVGQAEMEDTYLGYDHTSLTLEQIIDVYRFKTARYTFSLPMMIGALLANKESNEVNRLEELGECIGIIFQIKDDLIGLIGKEEKIGKPVGSDIAAYKKTVFAHLLFDRASEKDLGSLQQIFGNQNLTNVDVDFVVSKMKEYDVFKDVDGLIDQYAHQAKSLINELESAAFRELLNEVLDYNLKRIV